MRFNVSLKRSNIDTEYQKIIESVSGSFHMKPSIAPSPQELFDFMFHTEQVSADIADQSEKLIKRIMEDGRTWAWAEVDYSKLQGVADIIGRTKLVGALGVGEKDSDFDVLDLTTVHERWTKYRTKRADNTIHPLRPILEAWYAVKKKPR